MRDLSALFNPKSVCIIGASTDPKKLGAIILNNITTSKFKGSIYPVNPNFETIQNLKCFKSVGEIPDVPDLAIIVVPALITLQVLKEVGEKGIENAVCLAAGFKESGEEGKKLEEELLDIANKYEINLIGPNCLGFVNNLCPINATFGELVDIPGNLRFISQSGAIATGIFDWCKSINLGFSEFITLGNKTVVNENDVLQYFLDHPNSNQIEGLSQFSPIGLYLESISDGVKFLEITKKLSKTNPIFIIKPGKTKAAAKAMQSHTGAIAGEDAVFNEAISESGIIRCQTLEDFFDLSKAFSLENIPGGPKIAVISNAGGPAVISADAVVENGLELLEFDVPTKAQLEEALPRSASVKNPVDVLGDALADRYKQASEIILKDGQVDSLLIILTPQVMTQIRETAEHLGELSKKYQKPIFCAFLGGNLVAEGEKILHELKIPVFRFPERAIFAIGKMWKWKKNQMKEEQSLPSEINLDLTKTKEILENSQSLQQKTLDNFQANDIISSISIKTPPTLKIKSFEEAQNFVNLNGYPVVLKFSSPGLLHKKDIGGVITGINDDNKLENAWDKMERNITHLDEGDINKQIDIQIQKQILNGVEVILGIKRDPNFGPVFLFGAGGTLAELLGDRNLHLLPMDIISVKKIVENSKIFPLLSGFRGEAPLALDKLYEVILKLGKLVGSADVGLDISEIEINPLIITLNDAWAVDCKVVLTSEESKIINLPQFKIAQVLEHKILASSYHYLEFSPDESLKFLPGQYITVKVGSNKINCYSIATHAGDKDFSLLIDISPGGLGSHFFANLKVGDKISYQGSYGKFILNLDDGAKKILFLGTGSGIAPLRCQIESALKEKNCKLPITLYLGLETNKDLFWQDVFQKLAGEYSNFNFKIAIHDPQWGYSGFTGFITELLKNDLADGKDVAVYLCGNKNMITDATNILLEKGCLKERVYTEKY